MLGRQPLVLLIVADACWVGVSLSLALRLDCWHRSLPSNGPIFPLLVRYALIIVIWLLALLVCGAYELRYLALRGRNLSLTMCGSGVATAACAASFYLIPDWHMSRLAFVFLGAAGGLGLSCIRECWLRQCRGDCVPEFLAVGDPQVIATVWCELAQMVGAVGPLLVVSSPEEAECEPLRGLRYCSRASALDALARHAREIVVLCDGTIPSAHAASILSHASFAGSTVADIFTFYETCTGRAPIFRTHTGWLFRAQHRAPDQFAYACKRVLDLSVALLALPVVLPIVVTAAALIKLTSPGPVLFVQRRIGFRGREFSLVKLRTMRTEGDRNCGPWTGWNDSRVTRVGRLLRLLGIDELPQLWNVLRGELSLVGPRPEQPEVVRRIIGELPPYLHRHVVPCGITGWAQICRGSDLDLADVLDKVRLDLYYARHFSLWFDALILLRTFRMLLARAKPAPAALIARAGEALAVRRAVSAASGGPGG